MNSTVKELFERKSVRVYKDKEIEPEKKQLILESAIQAPTAGNMTLYSIIDIQDQEIKDKLAKSCDNQPFIAKAPLVLIFVADYQNGMMLLNIIMIMKKSENHLMAIFYWLIVMR